MIGIALLVIIVVLAAGLMLVYWSSRWDIAWTISPGGDKNSQESTDQQKRLLFSHRPNRVAEDERFPSTWWSKAQALRLCWQGILFAVAFMVLANLVLMAAAEMTIGTATVTNRVFTKAGLATDGTWLFPIFNAIRTSGTNGGYVNTTKTHEVNRKAFLAAYLVDLDKASELEQKDELKLLEAVVRERSFKGNTNNICSSGLDVFKVQWLTVASSSNEIPSLGDGKPKSCDEFIAQELPSVKDNSIRDCDLMDYGHQATKKVRQAYGMDWVRDLGGLIGLDGAPSSPRELLKSLEQGTTLKPIKEGMSVGIEETCNAQLVASFDQNPYAREVLLAQLSHLRDSLDGIYRAKALIWGPLQWLLLASFFAACLALGQRRAFSRDIDSQTPDDAHLHRFVRARLQAVVNSLSSDDQRLGKTLIERSTKNAINEELDDDASFPIDLTKYVLPTVGFIGTVIGIAASMDSAGGVVEASTQGVEAQLSAISLVTGQLGVAFDTTLLALAATAFVIFGHAYRRSCERRVVRKMPLPEPQQVTK
ncbi:MotA/TolQ/ExbB proton channel family protein [Marinobacter sp.]|uniref:MotA/TolQ/ExbB proton channel family protein n=1 Tax=Marinobacter sp. TaxID=50741 RepID=UPI003A955F3E